MYTTKCHLSVVPMQVRSPDVEHCFEQPAVQVGPVRGLGFLDSRLQVENRTVMVAFLISDVIEFIYKLHVGASR